MRTLFRRLWTRFLNEPAFAVAVVVGAGEFGLQYVEWSDEVEKPLAAGLALLGGAAVRALVSPAWSDHPADPPDAPTTDEVTDAPEDDDLATANAQPDSPDE